MPGSRPRVTAAPAPCLKMSRGITWVHPPKRGGRSMKENHLENSAKKCRLMKFHKGLPAEWWDFSNFFWGMVQIPTKYEQALKVKIFFSRVSTQQVRSRKLQVQVGETQHV